MSYDIDLRSACGGFSMDLGNVTWNLSPLFIWALDADDGIRSLDGMAAQSVASVVGDALAKIAAASPGELGRFEPPNGWGSVSGGRELLASIHQECLERPTGTIHVR